MKSQNNIKKNDEFCNKKRIEIPSKFNSSSNSKSPVNLKCSVDNVQENAQSLKCVVPNKSTLVNNQIHSMVKIEQKKTTIKEYNVVTSDLNDHKNDHSSLNHSNTDKKIHHCSNYFERITIKKCAKMLNKHDLANGYGLNEEQIAMFEETFQILDKDSNGFITLQEIREVMNSLGYWPSDEKIKQRIKAIDSDNSGTVDFQEFICMMSTFRKMKTPAELDQELKDIFKLFDKNSDGFIDKHELKDVLSRLGENITEDEIMEMIKEADLDGDSKVSFTEFRSILSENKPTIK